MATSAFPRSYRLVRASEGGNDDDPDDPGGRTSRGITQREYDAYRRARGLPPRDVWRAGEAEIREIYLISYWRPWCESLPAGVDYVFFDVSVLQGQTRAVKLLQRALRVKADGHIGIVTLSALAVTDARDIIVRMTVLRGQSFRAIVQRRPPSKKYLRGWVARANRVCDDALAMAALASKASGPQRKAA